MYVYRLDAQRDAAFLAEERKDPVTLCVFEGGQEIVACAGCRAVFLASTWTQIGGRCALCSPAAKGPTPTLPLGSTEDLIVRMRMTRTTEHFRIHSPSVIPSPPPAPPTAFPRTPIPQMRHPVQVARRRSRIGRTIRNMFVTAVVVAALYGVVSFVSGQIAVGALDSFLSANGMMGVKGFAESFLSFERFIGLRSDAPREFDLPVVTMASTSLSHLPQASLDGTSSRFYPDRWERANGSMPLGIGDRTYENGIGWYIDSKACSAQGFGSSRAVYKLDGDFRRLTFDIGAQPGWSYGEPEEYGTYCVYIEIDRGSGFTEVYNSLWQAFDWQDFDVRVDLDHAKYLSITLEQQRGTVGTLNVVLGNATLHT